MILALVKRVCIPTPCVYNSIMNAEVQQHRLNNMMRRADFAVSLCANGLRFENKAIYTYMVGWQDCRISYIIYNKHIIDIYIRVIN